MSKPTITIHNAETGEVVTRSMNAEELAQWEIDKANAEVTKQTEAARAVRRQALLDKLGITEEEARLLLGGN